jgi:hypothetical protein
MDDYQLSGGCVSFGHYGPTSVLFGSRLTFQRPYIETWRPQEHGTFRPMSVSTSLKVIDEHGNR